MKGYTVLYFDIDDKALSVKELLNLLDVQPRPVDAIIVKNSNGWKSPKLHIELKLRNEKGQIESIGSKSTESGLLTIDSFLKGNVSKLLFNGKNFSPSIIRRIEKLLMPPKGSNSKVKQIIIQTDEGKWVLNPRFIPNKKTKK